MEQGCPSLPRSMGPQARLLGLMEELWQQGDSSLTEGRKLETHQTGFDCFFLKACRGQEILTKHLLLFMKVDPCKLVTSLGPTCCPGAMEQWHSHLEDLGRLLQEEDLLLPSAFGQASRVTALPGQGLGPLWALLPQGSSLGALG